MFVIARNGHKGNEVTAVVSSFQGNTFFIGCDSLSYWAVSKTFSFVRWHYGNLKLNRTWELLRTITQVAQLYLYRSNSITIYLNAPEVESSYLNGEFRLFSSNFSQIVPICVVELKLRLVLAVWKLCKSLGRQIGTRSFVYSFVRSHWDKRKDKIRGSVAHLTANYIKIKRPIFKSLLVYLRFRCLLLITSEPLNNLVREFIQSFDR